MSNKNKIMKNKYQSMLEMDLQGDSKRLLKVHVSMIIIFFDAGDLKFCIEKLQNSTI